MLAGDIVGVGPLHAGPSAHIASGIVSRVGSSFVTVAFDGEQTDSLAVDNGEVYQLTKLANDVTYKRLKRYQIYWTLFHVTLCSDVSA